MGDAERPRVSGVGRARIEAAVAANRRRLWAICYRMTGSRTDADDLLQDAVARALERGHSARDDDPTGWLVRLTTRVCLDHLRRSKLERRVNQLVDPIDETWAFGEWRADGPVDTAILREDLRFAIVVALQHLSPRQRAALVLYEVCERSLDEVGEVVGTNANAAKALVFRARAALARARVSQAVDVPVDRTVVERFAGAIQRGDLDALVALLAADVWGVTDGGDVVVTATKPTFGRRVVGRQWANARRKIGLPVRGEVVLVNGEPSIVVRLAEVPSAVVALVHLETRAGEVASLRVSRDPKTTMRYGVA